LSFVFLHFKEVFFSNHSLWSVTAGTGCKKSVPTTLFLPFDDPMTLLQRSVPSDPGCTFNSERRCA